MPCEGRSLLLLAYGGKQRRQVQKEGKRVPSRLRTPTRSRNAREGKRLSQADQSNRISSSVSGLMRAAGHFSQSTQVAARRFSQDLQGSGSRLRVFKANALTAPSGNLAVPDKDNARQFERMTDRTLPIDAHCVPILEFHDRDAANGVTRIGSRFL